MDYIRICQQPEVNNQQPLSVDDVKELLKDWIKLYPNSFASDVEFYIAQLADGGIIIKLHEDLSSMAVSLLVLYFDNILGQRTAGSRQQTMAFVTIDDTEILLKQNIGKRAMICCQSTANVDASENQSVRFVLEDNYVLDYHFESRPKPAKDSDVTFEERLFDEPERYEMVRVGDVVKKKIDEVLEPEGLTPTKLMWYFICGAIGLAIGFLIVYFMGR